MTIGEPSLYIALTKIGYKDEIGLVVLLGFQVGRSVLLPERNPLFADFRIV